MAINLAQAIAQPREDGRTYTLVPWVAISGGFDAWRGAEGAVAAQRVAHKLGVLAEEGFRALVLPGGTQPTSVPRHMTVEVCGKSDEDVKSCVERLNAIDEVDLRWLDRCWNPGSQPRVYISFRPGKVDDLHCFGKELFDVLVARSKWDVRRFDARDASIPRRARTTRDFRHVFRGWWESVDHIVASVSPNRLADPNGILRQELDALALVWNETRLGWPRLTVVWDGDPPSFFECLPSDIATTLRDNLVEFLSLQQARDSLNDSAGNAITVEHRFDFDVALNTDEDQARFWGVFDRLEPAYKALFTDANERDDLEEIRQWLQEYRNEEGDWHEVFAILHAGGTPAGFVYFTSPKDRNRPYWFANYLGVLSGHRYLDAAKRLVNRATAELRRLKSESAGVVFEVEPVDFNLLPAILDGTGIGDHESGVPDTDTNLRRAQRVNLYVRKRCLLVVGANGAPVMIRQPAPKAEPDGTFDDHKEVPLWLFVYPMTEMSLDAPDLAAECVNVMFDVQVGARGPGTARKIPGWVEYVNRLRHKCLQEAGTARVDDLAGRYLAMIKLAAREAKDKDYAI